MRGCCLLLLAPLLLLPARARGQNMPLQQDAQTPKTPTTPTTAAAPPSEQPLHLEDAINLALANNERALKAPLRIDTAKGQRDRAITAFLPSLTAAGSSQWRATEDSANRNFVHSGTVTFSQPVLNPSAFPQYSQASHQLESEKWGALQDTRVLAFDTARAFLQVLTAERVLVAAERKLETAQANLHDSEARAQAGLTSTNDATRSRIDLASSQREVAQDEGTVARARQQLSFLLGRPVTGSLAQPERTMLSAQSVGTASANQIKTALDKRADVRSARERTLALRASAREPLYRLIPSASFQAQMRFLPDPLATERGVDEMATLNLSWAIFDAGVRYADRRTRLAQADSQALDEQLLRRSVDNDVKVATISLHAARDSYRILNDALTSAQKNVEETEILYRQGLAKAIEVIDANGRRFDSEVSVATAMLQMEQAYLDLRFALGLGPTDDDIPSALAR
ncbi:MAG: TolC family protein [Polyangiaceae bacterium]|nr:TolC family protein [Polyangiaceae bacterium]